MNDKNKINVISKISNEMKKVVMYQKEYTPKEYKNFSYDDQMKLSYEDERKFWNDGGPKMFDTKDVSVKFNNSTIKTRIYYPQKSEEYKIIFFIHGGGWVVGSINTHDRIMRNLAHMSKCAVIGIDYTLAPKGKFPLQIEECDAAIDYFINNQDEYKLSNKFVAYAGDSAGANICMGLYLWQMENNKKEINHIKTMLLFYGLYGLKDSASRSLYGNDIDWLRDEDLKYYFNEYLEKEDDINSKFVNILNADLSKNIPPCFIASCEFDPLKDDSFVLYEILKQYNDSEYKEYKGVMHAFLHYARYMTIATDAIQDSVDFLNRKFNIA